MRRRSVHWSYVDHLMLESGLARGSLFALPGNHDYMFKRDLHELTDRFPRLRRATHDAIDWGGLRLLLLDANRRELGERAWRRQLEWLDCELAAVARGCLRRGRAPTHACVLSIECGRRSFDDGGRGSGPAYPPWCDALVRRADCRRGRSDDQRRAPA